MPIGIDTLTGRRSAEVRPGPSGPPATRPPAPTRPPNPAPPPPAPPPAEPTTRIDTTPDLEVTVWTAWRTTADERVCPVCGPLAGQEWPADTGPQPPAHPNCRCRREFSRAEYRMRA